MAAKRIAGRIVSISLFFSFFGSRGFQDYLISQKALSEEMS